MKAILQDRYGPPDKVLRLEEIDKPVAGDDEVLVRVRTSCVHPDVWHAVTGRPYIVRLMGAGIFGPRDRVAGMDVAGRVEAVGKGVTRFGPGDEVFGHSRTELQWRNGGTFAEYAAIPEGALARKPKGVSFEQAGGVATSGYIALLNLRRGWVRPGQRVLVNGAGGGVGAIAVQLAKEYGARVTGVDGSEKLEMIRGLGADDVIDYTKEDFTRQAERYDLIFDVASNLSLAACKRVLTPEGTHVLIGHDHFGQAQGRVLGSVPRVLTYFALSKLIRQLQNPNPEAPIPSVGEAMGVLADLLRDGSLTPVIDRTYPLEEAREAMAYLQAGRVCGRIILTV